ncbi:MAG: leucine-rich repeat domain-containing protein [Crocinitomicaceae bacterium]
MNKALFLLFLVPAFNQISFSQNTYVPDNVFESTLISLGFDTGPLDDSVPTQNLTGVTSLDFSWSQVSDLTGIEDCINLLSLDCFLAVYITDLDVSNNTSLTYLSCVAAQITSLDVTNNTALEFLDCTDTQITSLDVSQNVNLESLACVDVDISSLDVSQNPLLTSLQCAGNQITNLDLSNNVNLTELYCSNNLITGLDLSIHPNLEMIKCSSNNLSYLKVNNGNNLNVPNFGFNASNNPNLLCVVVDSVEWSDLNWNFIDPQTNFNDTCYYLAVDENTVQIEAFPNPVSDVFNVLLDQQAYFTLYTSSGKLVKDGLLFHGKNTILVNELDSGVYFLIVQTKSSKSVLKVLVK